MEIWQDQCDDTPLIRALRRPAHVREEVFLGYAVLIVGIALRILYLDADPDYYAYVGYITDEGRWVNSARELVLFGRIINVDWLFHLLVAPLFQAANYAVFKLLGVSIWTARLVTALSGSAVLIVFWLALRRVVTPQAMLVGLALLAFEVDLVMLSRVAIPEMPAMLLELLVYVVLVAGRALGACFAMIGWLASEKETVEPRLRRYFVTSAIWYVIYALLILSTYYFPDRYKVHILIPMGVNIATGLSIVQGATFTKLRDALSRMTRSRRELVLGLLSLPTAALWAPSLARVIAFVGVDAARLRVKLACFATALLAAAWVARRRALAGESVRVFFVFPIVGMLGWLLSVRAGLAANSFWPVAGGEHLGWWSVGVPVAALVSGLLARVGRGWDTRRWVALIPAVALCYAVLSVVRILPSYMHPRYSIKHPSKQLGHSLAGSSTIIGSSRTEGLFTGNTLPYRAVNFGRWPDPKPEIIVIGVHLDDPEKFPGREYSLIATYRLFVSPEYEDEHSLTLDTTRHEEVAKVYRRNSAAMSGR